MVWRCSRQCCDQIHDDTNSIQQRKRITTIINNHMGNVTLSHTNSVTGANILGHHVIQTMTTSHDTGPAQPSTNERHYVPGGSCANGLQTSYYYYDECCDKRYDRFKKKKKKRKRTDNASKILQILLVGIK
jgi:hypothetical protein